MNSIDVVGTGFTVLDRIYADNSRLPFETLGGTCGNVLLSLAMLQRHVAPLLNLGMDEIGGRLVGEFIEAGAETRFIRRRQGRLSPILAQHLDTRLGRHFFAFICPETDTSLPRYESIEQEDVEHALSVLTDCTIFYTDRLSEAIVVAMEAAAEAGAIVYFEPSSMKRYDLFERAVKVTSVLKFSADRLGWLANACDLPQQTISIATHGEAGLEIRKGKRCLRSRSFPATVVRDTCGSGDMVSVGLIDWLITLQASRDLTMEIETLVPGIQAGQRLAAENCAFTGARGLFTKRGAKYARAVLSGTTMESLHS